MEMYLNMNYCWIEY